MNIKDLDLTDFFAAAALIGLIARDEENNYQRENPQKWLATRAYEYAEQMIEAKLDLEEQ
jgi:hypothetical protein